MLAVQNKSTKRIRIIQIILFLVIIFLTSQPFVWNESYYKDTVKDIAIESGDFVTMSLVGKVDGKVFTDEKSKEISYQVGDDKFIKGLDKNLIGHKENETFTFKLKLPKKSSNKAIAGKTAEFTANIKSVTRKITFTVFDMISYIGAAGNGTSQLTTIGLCYILFLVIPAVALGFQLFDRKYNLKNIVGIICSAAGILCILYFVGAPYICFASMISIILYLLTAFLSVMGIFARYLKEAAK